MTELKLYRSAVAMSVMPSRFPAKDFVSKWKLFCFPVLTLAFCASSGWAQAPSNRYRCTADSWVLGTTSHKPSRFPRTAPSLSRTRTTIKLSRLTPFLQNRRQQLRSRPARFTLSTPQALALDANGDLFVGDTPSSGIGGRIIELIGRWQRQSDRELRNVVFSGAPLTNPFALTVDSTGTCSSAITRAIG